MRRELELKVELSREDMARLTGDLQVGEILVGPPLSHKLKSVYFDTPEHDLHAAGISLRLRRENDGWLQTIKAGQQVADGVSNPVELEAPVDGDEPDIERISDKGLKRTVRQAVEGTTLRPVFETIVQRTTRKIEVHSSVVELAIDEGEVRAGEDQAELREAELELKSGSAEGLLLAAEALLAGHELRLSRRSKSERGYRLALGKKGSGAEPHKARPISLRRKYTGREALSAILTSATQQVTVNRLAVLETDDPNAAHQLRIGLRRLRSALRALRPFINSRSLRAFENSARDLARRVGVLRDADVLISNIYMPMEASASDRSGFTELREALISDRTMKRDAVRSALRGPEWTKLQLYLTLWPHTLEEARNLDGPVTKLARTVLSKAWKKSERCGKHLQHLEGEERHEMRKALKKLRYQAEFFAPLFKSKNARSFIARLKSLQDVFGYVNDVGMAPRLVEVCKDSGAGSEAGAAARYIVGRHETESLHVWRQARKAWKDLQRTNHFWV